MEPSSDGQGKIAIQARAVVKSFGAGDSRDPQFVKTKVLGSPCQATAPIGATAIIVSSSP